MNFDKIFDLTAGVYFFLHNICCVGVTHLVSGNAVRVFRLVVSLSCLRGSFGSRTPQLLLLRRAVLSDSNDEIYMQVLQYFRLLSGML